MQAWQLVEQLPRVTYAVLDCAGHARDMQQETLYTALVNEWRDRVEREIGRP